MWAIRNSAASLGSRWTRCRSRGFATTTCSCALRQRASAAPISTSSTGTNGPVIGSGRPSRSATGSPGQWWRSAETSATRLPGFVSAESHVTCGMCFECRTGQAHMCERTQILGVDRDGAFAEYVAVPGL